MSDNYKAITELSERLGVQIYGIHEPGEIEKIKSDHGPYRVELKGTLVYHPRELLKGFMVPILTLVIKDIKGNVTKELFAAEKRNDENLPRTLANMIETAVEQYKAEEPGIESFVLVRTAKDMVDIYALCKK